MKNCTHRFMHTLFYAHSVLCTHCFMHIQDVTGLLGSCGCYSPRPLLLEKDNDTMQERQEASTQLRPPWYSQGCHGHGSEGCCHHSRNMASGRRELGQVATAPTAPPASCGEGWREHGNTSLGWRVNKRAQMCRADRSLQRFSVA